MTRFREILFAYALLLPGLVYAAEPVPVLPMPESLQSKAESAEATVRSQFAVEVGHQPKTSRELLEWLDAKSLSSKDLNDEQKDERVQSYGAALGQILIRELGGRWVIVPSQDNAPGVDLPNGKVAFVFNRAGRRVLNADPIGFVEFFDTTASYVRGSQLPAGVEAKVER